MEQNLSTYRIFFEVAKQGNISKAAEALYISQPAISKTIVRLEDNLNTKLFKRNSRGVSLTEEGEVLFRHVEEAIHSIEDAESTLQKMKDCHIGHLSIGAEYSGFTEEPGQCEDIAASGSAGNRYCVNGDSEAPRS